jgi:hypothetical protein
VAVFKPYAFSNLLLHEIQKQLNFLQEATRLMGYPVRRWLMERQHKQTL